MDKPEVPKVTNDCIATQAAKETIVAGASYTSDSFSLEAAKAFLAGMQVVFGGTPDGNAKLEVLTSPDDSNWDTEAFTVFEIDFQVSQTLMKSMPVNPDAMYAKIKVTNLDSADNISVWAFTTLTWDFV